MSNMYKRQNIRSKTNIFNIEVSKKNKRLFNFYLKNKNESIDWYEINVENVKKLVSMNEKGKSVSNLDDFVVFKEEKDYEKSFV